MTKRLDNLRAMRDRLDTEIAREEAYQRRLLSLRGDWRETVGGGRAQWTERIILVTAGYYGLTPEDLVSDARTRKILEARYVAAWLLREAGRSYPEIGRHVGKDHTTVINSVRRVQESPELMYAAATIQRVLHGEDEEGVA